MEQWFVVWRQSLVDEAQQWERLAGLLRESSRSLVAGGPVGELAARAAEEAEATAHEVEQWAVQMRAWADDVGGIEEHVVADMTGLLRRLGAR